MLINDELIFWRNCCKCGISVCQIPKPMKETELVWLVVKTQAFYDRHVWKASHTFDSLEDVFFHVGHYLSTGNEPRSRAEGRV